MTVEAHRSFDCFGGTATIHIRAATAAAGSKAADLARERLLDAHRRLSRFSAESELARLNEDPRWEVPASPLLLALADAAARAGSHSDGLVDATLVDAIERAGYRHSLDGSSPITLAAALAGRADRAPGQPHPDRPWRTIGIDQADATVIRPPGVKIDSGGIAKGLMADLVAEGLCDHPAYAIDSGRFVVLRGTESLRVDWSRGVRRFGYVPIERGDRLAASRPRCTTCKRSLEQSVGLSGKCRRAERRRLRPIGSSVRMCLIRSVTG